VVISYLIRTAEYVNNKSKKKCILEAVDSMSLNFSRKRSSNRLLSLVYLLETKLCAMYEKRIKFDSIITVASKDSSYFKHSNVHTIPLGVDTNCDILPKLSGSPSLIFTGNFFYSPNVDSLSWFVDNIFFNLVPHFPNIKLHVVGRNSDLLIGYDNPKIILHGSVNNLYSYINASDISVAPMTSGSGMQFKILEAMSIGCPVITSDIGLGDIQASPNFNVLIANDLDEYIHAINFLLHPNDISKNAMKFIEKNHQWDDLNNKFINLIVE
jgi:glycosyltransferase involved in cell wall biosynthesis